MKSVYSCVLTRTLPSIAFGLSSLLLSEFTLAQATVPGTIQAENFISDPYTNAVVGKENTQDTGLGQNVGWIDSNDWMRYSINVTTAGQYKVTFRVASSSGGGKVVLTQNGKDISAVTDLPYTGGWQNWDYAYTSIYLNAGVQEIMVYATAGGFNLNWLQLTPVNTNTGLTSLKVWPIGDSMTAGASNNWKNWSPENGGYRRNLMLLLNDGYNYEFIGSSNWPNLGNLPTSHSGHSGQGSNIFSFPEFSPENIRNNNPDAVLLLLGINSIGHRGEYPDAQGQYWSVNGNRFNRFFNQYRDFIDKMLANSNTKVFIAKLPAISNTRYYQQTWDDTKDVDSWGWRTVGNGSVNPKDVVPAFNTELQALYNTYYANNPRVVLVDMSENWRVGKEWENDITELGVPQRTWNGDGLHPTQMGYRNLAEKWNSAIRRAIPTSGKLLYSVDCGAREGVVGMAAEGAVKGSAQSVVWDKPYGPDSGTGKNWGHVGTASYGSATTPAPAGTNIWFAWENSNNVYDSVATATAGNDLKYRFDVPAGGKYRVYLGFHDSWADNWSGSTDRAADIYIDGNKKGSKFYQLKDFGRSSYDVDNTTGTLEVIVRGTNREALLDSIQIKRIN